VPGPKIPDTSSGSTKVRFRLLFPATSSLSPILETKAL
jgi:hypothetical protein